MRYCRVNVRACGDVHPQKAGRVLQEFAPFFSNSAAVLVLPCMRLVAPHKLQTKAVPLKKYQCLASRIRKKAAYSLSKYLLPSTFAHNINFFGSCVRFHYVLLIIRDARVSRGWQLTHQSWAASQPAAGTWLENPVRPSGSSVKPRGTLNEGAPSKKIGSDIP